MILVLLLDIGFGGNLTELGKKTVNSPTFWAAFATLAANSAATVGSVVAAVVSSPVTLPILAGVGVAGVTGLVVAALLEEDDKEKTK